MSGKLYLRPTGLLWGETAADSIRDGTGLPLAGGPVAFLGLEVIEGAPGSATRKPALARDLATSADAQIKALLARLTAPRQPLAGVPMTRTRVMGIVNVTPDSFSDGGDFASSNAAVAQAQKLAEEGAEFIDIGGESTRPGSMEVDEAEELRRICPILEELCNCGTPISIDTRKAAVMEAAAARGATIINDVSALTHDSEGLAMAKRLGVPIVLMHARGDPRTMQDNPVYDDVVLEVYDYLEERVEAAVAAGVARDKLVVDPGIGFGKTLDHNLALLSTLSILHGLGVPVLLGASRKRIIGSLTGKSDPKARMPGSIGVALVGAAQGIQILRVHDVDETRQALDVWTASVMGEAPE